MGNFKWLPGRNFELDTMSSNAIKSKCIKHNLSQYNLRIWHVAILWHIVVLWNAWLWAWCNPHGWDAEGGRWSGLTATSNTPLDRDASTSKVHQMAPLKLRSSTSTYVYFVQMLRQTNIYVLLWFVFKLAVLEVVPELHPCNSGTGSRVAPVQLGTLPRARAQIEWNNQQGTNKVQLARHPPYVKIF